MDWQPVQGVSHHSLWQVGYTPQLQAEFKLRKKNMVTAAILIFCQVTELSIIAAQVKLL